MKIKQILTLILLFSPIAGSADVGDIHTIKVDNAIIREGPDKSSPQIDKLAKNTEIMEMDIQGEWYEIYVADTDMGGWAHVSNLEILGGGDSITVSAEAASTSAAPTTRSSQPAQAAKATNLKVKSGGAKSAGMKEFEKYLIKYNARTNVLKGYIPFTGAEDAGDGNLYLTVTNNWLERSKARQKSSLITLYTRWKLANESANVKVYAVDQSGNPIGNYPR